MIYIIFTSPIHTPAIDLSLPTLMLKIFCIHKEVGYDNG